MDNDPGDKIIKIKRTINKIKNKYIGKYAFTDKLKFCVMI